MRMAITATATATAANFHGKARGSSWEIASPRPRPSVPKRSGAMLTGGGSEWTPRFGVKPEGGSAFTLTCTPDCGACTTGGGVRGPGLAGAGADGVP